ncbi:MAG: ABC transporter substrate binding protein [Chloroflexi bacterium]|nr:ABC transporter substrate binding protein [Chloroflexota bacterium]
MCKKCSLTVIVLALLFAPATLAQGETPTVAILRYGNSPVATFAEQGILDALQIYEFINMEERPALNERQDAQGENINIIFGDANNDLPTANVMVANALDKGADVLMTITTPVTQIAVNSTLDQDEPTPVFFTAVFNPYRAGIAQASCIKPDHVAGSLSVPSYEDVFRLLLQQNPGVERIGTMFASGDAGSAYGAEVIAGIGESLGIAVESAAITSVSDLRPAIQGLVNKGIEAIVLPISQSIEAGFPIISAIANENLIPMYYPNYGAAIYGAMIGAGFYQNYTQGLNVGLMLTAWLNGDLDIATTRIDRHSAMAVGVNLDAAAELGIEIAEAVMEEADMLVENDLSTVPLKLLGGEYLAAMGADESLLQLVQTVASNLSLDDMQRVEIPPAVTNFLIEGRKAEDFMQRDIAYLASLHCADEMIAEQQAALGAAE